jgi:hypothetical protein
MQKEGANVIIASVALRVLDLHLVFPDYGRLFLHYLDNLAEVELKLFP